MVACVIARDACTPFVTSSDTTSSASSVRAARPPHSRSTCLACSRADGTAPSSAPSSRKLCSGHIGSDYADLISLEAEARTIRTYEQELVPGLLQTPEYAQAVIRASRATDTTEQIKRRVEVRIERQEILNRADPPPPRFSVVLSEAALRRPVGGYDVMLRQLEYLMLPRDRANVTVQVLPFDAGVHPSMVAPFTMMTFPDPDDLGLVNVENAIGTLFLEEPAELQAYDEIWGALQASALSPDDTQTFLRSTSFAYRAREGMK
jgi:hypothetical protein